MIDIYSGGKYPCNVLSNFAEHHFMFRGFQINSMEGFIQGLTHKDPIEQMRIFLLTGIDAKNAALPWEFNQTVYWQGQPIKRYSAEYQDLFDDAYEALFTNPEFKKALLSTKGQTLVHPMGGKVKKQTLLTEKEFVNRLTLLRDTGKCKYQKYENESLF